MPLCKYDWDKWFARKRAFTLKRGKDFTCMPHSMAQLIRSTAAKYGLSVRIRICEDEVTVRVQHVYLGTR